MRYQGASADSMPSSNLKKAHVKLCKKEANLENGRILNGSHPSTPLEGKAVRTKGGSSTSNNGNHHKVLEYVNSIPEPFREKANEDRKTSQENQPSGNRVTERGDLLLQWGQNKRSRGYRAEYKSVVEESPIQAKKNIRIDRRNGRHDQQTLSTQAQLAVHPRSTSLRPCTPVRDPYIPCLNNRSLEDPSASGNGANLRNKGLSSEGRIFHKKADGPSPKSPEKADKADTVPLQTNRGLGDSVALEPTPSETDAFAHVEKLNLDMFEWPKIYVSLSRKEKEDDFLAIKGSKLPQRPKKRAKNVDKTLQYCFPGNWLSDLTRARYEVREKKCIKKKPRGLKAMEILDSDSE